MDASTGKYSAFFIKPDGTNGQEIEGAQDGAQIVFMRGTGIFDLFLINSDGQEMHQITHGGVQEWPTG